MDDETMSKEEMRRQKKNAYMKEYHKRKNYTDGAAYNKEHATVVSFRLFSPGDDDILEFLKTIAPGGKNAYLRQLIRDDMAKRKAEE